MDDIDFDYSSFSVPDDTFADEVKPEATFEEGSTDFFDEADVVVSPDNIKQARIVFPTIDTLLPRASLTPIGQIKAGPPKIEKKKTMLEPLEWNRIPLGKKDENKTLPREKKMYNKEQMLKYALERGLPVKSGMSKAEIARILYSSRRTNPRAGEEDMV